MQRLKYSGLLLFSIIFSFGIIGCGKSPVQKKLAVIDNIIEEHPDSALRLLQELPSGSLESRGDSAYYGLLYTYALLKNHISPDNDSLITLARNWYASHGSKTDRMRANMLYGKVKFYQKDYAQAIIASTEASKIANELSDDYWHAKSVELNGEIMSNTLHFNEALEYYREAADSYQRCNRIINHLYSLLDITRTIANLEKYQEANSFLDSIQKIAKQNPDTYFIESEITKLRLYISLLLQDIDSADSAFVNLRNDSIDYIMLCQDYVNISLLFAYKKRFDDAKYYLKKARQKENSKYDNYILNDAYSYLYSVMDDSENANNYKDSSLNALSNILFKEQNSKPIQAQRDFYQESSKKDNNRFLNKLIFFISLIVLLLLSGIFLITKNRKRFRVTKLQMGELRGLLSNANSENKDLKEKIDLLLINNKEEECLSISIRDQISDLYRKQWQTINLLANEYFENENGSKKDCNIIVNNLYKEITNLRSPQKLKKIHNELNSNFDGIMDKISEEFPLFTKAELNLISLNMAGLSPKAICLILDIKYKSFFTKRSRLIQKMEESESVNKNLFLQFMGKPNKQVEEEHQT